jgi:hypothetical protein
MKKSAILIAMTVSFLFAFSQSRAGEDADGGFRIFVKGQDQIYAFTMDLIRSLKECRHTAGLNPSEDVDSIDRNDLFSGIAKLESARSRMVNWMDCSEEDVSKVARHFSLALDDLISCWEFMGKAYPEKNVPHAGLAIATCKKGHQKIREAAPLIVRVFFRQDNAKPGLSKERLRLILQFCEDAFHSELAAIEKRPAAAMEEPFASPIFVLKLSLQEATEGMK